MNDIELVVGNSRRKSEEYIPRFSRDVGRLLTALAELKLAEMRKADGKDFSLTDYEGKVVTACIAVLYNFRLMVESLGVTERVENGARQKLKKTVKNIEERILTYGC